MGTLFVDNIKQQSSQGSGTITIGASGETVSFASGVTGTNYPAFHAFLNSTQDLSNGVRTKISFANEEIDTNNCYDSSTNYRFTPTVAGKYLIYTQAVLTASANTQFVDGDINIFKNGSGIAQQQFNFQSNPGNSCNGSISRIVEFNGSSDYVESFAQINTNNSNQKVLGSSSTGFTLFGGFRIGA